MDFDIGNIFYVVITLVAVIVGLLGRKKKKPTTGSEPGKDGSQSQPGFLENLENILKMGQEEPRAVDLQDYEEDLPEEEEVPEQVISERPAFSHEGAQDSVGILAEYERMMEMQREPERDTILADIDNITDPLEVIQIDDEEGTDYFEIIKDFDAGTAVVYSAIINRLDY